MVLFKNGNGEFFTFEIPNQGSQQFVVSEADLNEASLVFGLSGSSIEAQTFRVDLDCPYQWFFSPADEIVGNVNSCPGRPIGPTNGAKQRFENGTMFWVEATDQIYVHLFNGTSEIFTDNFEDSMPADSCPEINVSSGIKPDRGFGLVWCQFESVRTRLGNPITGPSGYPTLVQKSRNLGRAVEFIKIGDGSGFHILEIPTGSRTWFERTDIDGNDNNGFLP